MPPNQVEPVTVLGLPVQLFVPVFIAGMALTCLTVIIVTIAYLALRDTPPEYRGPILDRLAKLITAVGDAIAKVLHAVSRIFRSGPPPGRQ
jgi:hypothetical protein